MSGKIGDLSAAERNKQPIFDVLIQWVPEGARVLEIGAGDGTHACYAVKRLPGVFWQATEAPAHLRRLTAALVDAAGPSLPAPRVLDVRDQWPAERYDAVFGANIAHIMTEDAVAALFAGAASHLVPGGLLCLYGPFLDRDETPGAGNLAFDRALRARGEGMGLRERGALDALAASEGLQPTARRVMPTDNRLLIWRRATGADDGA